MVDDIHTNRLRLVPNTPEDCRAQIENMAPHEKAELSPAWLALVGATTTADPWVLGFALVHKTDDVPLGGCGFKGPPDADGMVEIAYGIAPEHQNQGYATEAAAALVRFALASGQVRVVRAHTLADVGASARVLVKCGFRSAGQVIEPDDGLVWRWETTEAP